MHSEALIVICRAREHLRAAKVDGVQSHYLNLCHKQLSTSLDILKFEDNPLAYEVEMALEHLKTCLSQPNDNGYAFNWLRKHLNQAISELLVKDEGILRR